MLPSEVRSENEIFLYALASCLSCHDDFMKRYVGVRVTIVRAGAVSFRHSDSKTTG